MIEIELNKQPNNKFEELICLDPGGKTGYARLKIDYVNKAIHVVEIGEFQTWRDLHKLTEYARACTYSVCVVYEGFQVMTLAANLIPVEVIGVIRYLCLNKDVWHFMQMPHERKVVDRWFASQMKDFPSHYGSAIRHGIFFAVKNLFGSQLPKLVYNRNELMKNYVN